MTFRIEIEAEDETAAFCKALRARIIPLAVELNTWYVTMNRFCVTVPDGTSERMFTSVCACSQCSKVRRARAYRLMWLWRDSDSIREQQK